MQEQNQNPNADLIGAQVVFKDGESSRIGYVVGVYEAAIEVEVPGEKTAVDTPAVRSIGWASLIKATGFRRSVVCGECGAEHPGMTCEELAQQFVDESERRSDERVAQCG